MILSVQMDGSAYADVIIKSHQHKQTEENSLFCLSGSKHFVVSWSFSFIYNCLVKSQHKVNGISFCPSTKELTVGGCKQRAKSEAASLES